MIDAIHSKAVRSVVLPFVLAVVLACLLPMTAEARQLCPGFRAPTVIVDLDQAPVSHDFSAGIAQLTERVNADPNSAGAYSDAFYGLSVADVQYRLRVTTVHGSLFDGTVCVAASAIHVGFGYKERRLHVAAELPEGSCIHREILAHEMQHVAQDEHLLRHFVPDLRRRVQALASRLTPERAGSRAKANRALVGKIEAVLKDAQADLLRLRRVVHGHIDSDAEYRRLGQVCDRELVRYARGPVLQP